MSLPAITELLGGRSLLGRRVENDLDLVELGNRGIPKSALVCLARHYGLTLSQMARLLPITERTIQRYSPKSRFSQVVTEHILHLAEVAARGTEVFGDRDIFLPWLRQPNPALADRAPMDLLSSRFGVEMVLDELGRIEHGVFS